MSLAFYLKRKKEEPLDLDDEFDFFFGAKITHNLGKMANEAGIYQVLWRPEEIGVTVAVDVIPTLREGLCKLVSDPAFFKQYDASNGWRTYPDFLRFCLEVLEACIANPGALVEASR